MMTDLCSTCYDVMIFEPGAAPTIELDDGTNGGEICEKCARRANVLRQEMGLELLPIPPGTYGEVLVS